MTRKVETIVKPTPGVKELKIVGNTPFKVNSASFVVSPLSSDCEMFVISIHNGVEDKKKITDLHEGEYTQIVGLVPDIKISIETEDEFYVKY